MTGEVFNLEVWGKSQRTAYRRALRIARGIFKVLRKCYIQSEGLNFDYFVVSYVKTTVKKTRKNRLGLYKFALYFHR